MVVSGWQGQHGARELWSRCGCVEVWSERVGCGLWERVARAGGVRACSPDLSRSPLAPAHTRVHPIHPEHPCISTDSSSFAWWYSHSTPHSVLATASHTDTCSRHAQANLPLISSLPQSSRRHSRPLAASMTTPPRSAFSRASRRRPRTPRNTLSTSPRPSPSARSSASSSRRSSTRLEREQVCEVGGREENADTNSASMSLGGGL